MPGAAGFVERMEILEVEIIESITSNSPSESMLQVAQISSV